MRGEDVFDVWGADDIWLKGHRIALEDVLDLSLAGKSVEEIVSFYPTLSADHVRAVLAYYETHRDDLEGYLARQRQYTDEQARLAEAHPSASVARMRAIRRSRAATDPANTSVP